MGKDVKKKFTVSLDIDTKDAEKQVKASAENIKQILSGAIKDGVGVKELRNIADAINSIFEGIGQMPPLDIDKNFKGNGSAEKRIELLTKALENLGTVIDQIKIGSGGNSGDLSKDIQSKIDKLQKQKQELQEVIDVINNPEGTSVKLSGKNEEQLEQLKAIKDEYVKAREAKQQFEKSNMTNTSKYLEAVGRYARASAMIKSAFQSEDLTDEGIDFAGTGENLNILAESETFIKNFHKNFATRIGQMKTIFSDFITNINTELGKIQKSDQPSESSAYDELKKKLQEYYELKLKLKNVEEDPAEYNNLQDRQRAIQDEIYAMKELSEESENAFYDLFDSIDAEDNLQLNDAITQFCNILKVDIPNGADQAVSAATSAFAKIAQEADKASESAQKVMYHLGNLLNGKGQARDTFGDMAENLTTNAIGTQYEKYGFGALGGGLFGVIDPSTISQEPGKSNFIQSIDISKYNMYMADTEERAIALIDFLSKLQKFSMKSAEPNYAGFDAYLQGIDINSLYDQFKVVFEQSDLTKEKFQEFINEMVVLLKQAGLTFDAKTGELNFTNISKELAGSENISTRFMKMLGFEGVNTGITSLGGLGQGSVLFDFNKVDIVGYFDSVKSAIQDYERIVQQTDGKEWVGTTEQLQQYANNIDVIIDKMQQYKNSGVLKDTSGLDETLNKLTQIRENISDILSGKNISGNSPFETITTGPDKTMNSIQEAESKLQEFLSLADEINKKSFDVYGNAEDNVEIGKYTERLTTAKATLDELGDQGLLTAEQLNQVQEAFNRANSNLDLSTSHYNGYGDRYYDYSYYDEYKEQQNRADDLEAQKRDLENELARKEERITELESDLRASDGASEQILDEKYELQVENENLKEALSHREMSDDELEVLRQENSALEEKLELLQNIAEQYANTVTPKNREKYEELNQKDMDSGLTSKQEERFWELGEAIDLADQQLEEFGETYDKIILKLSNGKKIEILPDDAGLRKFDKIANEYYQGEYNGFEIEDVIFMRKQEQAAIEQNNQKLERQLDIQEQIATAQKETPESQQAETIANNAKAITSWEELCQVVERYNEIVLKAKTEGQTLTNEDEAELSRINDRFAATKGVAGDPNKFVDYAMAMSRISGILGEYNPNRLAEYFGIEIPQAAAKATDAIQEVAQATEDSSAPPDTSASTAKYEAEIQVIKQQNDELERNQQLKVQEGALDTNSSVVGDMSQESKQLDELHAKLVAVKEAVDAKTQAFEEEYVAVNAAVAAEIESLNKLKLLLDNIQNLLQITFTSTKQSFGDINLSQDQSGTNKTVSGILQSIQGTLEQIYGVLTGFTGVESDNKNSLKYKEPVADAPAKTSDVYDALVNKLPSEIATEGTLSTIKESIQQLVNLYKPKEDDKNNESSNTQETLSKLVTTLTVSVKTLQDVANGIVDHQKTQQTNKSVAMAKMADPIQYKQVVDIATSAVGQLGSEVQVKGLQALANGAIKVEGAFKDANGAWQGFTVKVNEANQAVDLATDKQSSFAKSLNNTSDMLTQQNAKLNGVTKQANELYKSLKINPLDTSDSATAVKDVYSKLLETLDVYKKKKDALTDDELNGLQQIYAQLMKNAQAYAVLHKGTNKKVQKAYGSNIMQNRIAQRNTLTTKVSADTALSGSSVMASAMKEYDDAWNRLNVLYTKLKNTPNPAEDDKIAFKEASAECNNLGKEVEKLLKSYAKMHSDSNVVGETPLENYANRAKELQDYVEATYGAKAVIGDFKNNYNELEFTIDNGNGTFTKAKVAVDNLRTSLVETAGDTQTVTSKWGQFVNDLKGKFRSISTYLISMTGFQEVWQQIRQGIQYVREIDSALTELKKVTDETDTTYRNFLQSMSKAAGIVGSTTSQLTQSAADWARLGSIIKSAPLYSNI